MLNDIKKTGKHTSVYAIGNAATKLIGLILIPLYTNSEYLSPADYGVLAILEATSQLLIGILTMAMVQSLTRWYWDEKYKKSQKAIFFTTLSFLTLMLIPIGATLILTAERIAQLILNNIEYAYLLRLTVVAALLQIINNQVLCLAKLQSRSLLYIITQISKLSITLGLILWGIIYKGEGLNAIWEASIIGELIILLALIPYILKNSTLKIHFKILIEMLSYGLPLMLASVSGVLLATMDRYMLGSMSSFEKTGIYSLGFRIANTLKVVIATSIATALSPLRMKKMNAKDNQRFYSKTNTYIAFILSLAVTGISLFSLELIKLFTQNNLYWEAVNIVPILSFAIFLGVMKDSSVISLAIIKKTKIIGLLIVATSLVNIVLNFILIPIIDIYGASLATLLSQLFFFITITVIAQKRYPIPYEWKKVGLLIALSALIIGIGILLNPYSLIIRLVIKSIMLIAFPFILYFFKFYEPIEIETLRNIAHSWLQPRKLCENIKRLMKS